MKLIKNILRKLGFEIRRIDPFPIGSAMRPVGDMKRLLQDLKYRGLDCKSIIDVGAHVGSWSSMAHEIFPSAKFCLIEPQIVLEDIIKDFCSRVKGSIYFMLGAGEKTEEKLLTTYDDLTGASLLPHENQSLVKSGKQLLVKLISLDEIVKSEQFTVPELVKIDVQGFEIETLKGAEFLFGKTEVFIIEVSFYSFGDDIGFPVFSDIVNFMLAKDYVVYDFPGFLRRPYDGALAQCDICFVKRNGFLRNTNRWE